MSEIPLLGELPAGGISLNKLGLDETAFPKDAAIRLLASLIGADVAVLGGDVYFRENRQIAPAYDNWCCDRNLEESLSDYSRRSQEVARMYVETYVGKSGDPLFVLVMDSDVTAGM